MSTRRFLELFFRRAAVVVRDTYGDTAYLDCSGGDIVIRDKGGFLGTGQSVREAMAMADKTVKQRKQTAA